MEAISNIVSESWVATDDETRLFARKSGHASDLPPVVAVHGAPGLQSLADSFGMWEFLGEDRLLVTFDGRGSGRSETASPITMQRWATDIEAIRRWLDVDQIVVVAHSYGGFIALDYASRYPGHLASLIVVNSAANGNVVIDHVRSVIASVRNDVTRAQLDRLFSGTTQSNADLWTCGQAIVSMSHPEYVPSLTPPAEISLHHTTHNQAFASALPAYQVEAHIGKVTCPTLVCAGQLDSLIPPSFCAAIASAILGAQVIPFHHSAHNPALDEPDRFKEIVLSFLQQPAVDRLADDDPNRKP